MPSPTPHARYTLGEFLRLEEFANVKHEFLGGQIYALAGGTPEHGAIAMRVGASLVDQLRGRRCSVYSSDVRVRVVATGLETYPDLSVVCGEERRDAEDRNALTNPVVLVEVLSPSSAEYDRGEKLDHYKRIPELREVVLVSPEASLVEVWRRRGDEWSSEALSEGDTVELCSIECQLDVGDVSYDPLAP